MIVSWMIFATVIGLLLTCAAFAVERLAITLKLPTRSIWGLALVMTVVWPIAASIHVATAGSVRGGVVMPMSESVPMTRMLTSLQIVASRMPAGDIGHTLDRGILIMWGLFSLALMGRLLWSMSQLYGRRHTWKRAELDGVAVRLSSDVGPAVIGFKSMEVVLPEWVLAFDAPLRTLILRHEQEHRSAGDPLLLLLTTLAVTLVPWNLALWWQSRRLRLAVEVDCDGRVLAAHPQQGRYGLLLLALAQRKTNAPIQCAPALMESTSHLERRIVAMRNRTLPISSLRLLTVSVMAISAIALACGVESPTRPSASGQIAKLDVSSGRKVEKVMHVTYVDVKKLPDSVFVTDFSGPMIVVDRTLTNFPIDQIDPGAIEKIKVLKGPSASALYGVDADHGLIVITTKKGLRRVVSQVFERP